MLLRASTGEDWPNTIYDLSKTTFLVFPYYLIFIILCQIVMLSLFILILIQEFEEYTLQPNNAVEEFKDYMDGFKKTWAKYSLEQFGLRVFEKDLPKLVAQLPFPLGPAKEDAFDINNYVMKINLMGDEEGVVYFNELLYEVTRLSMEDCISTSKNQEVLNFIVSKNSLIKNKLKKKKLEVLFS